jgi:ATP-binding cassette subfamily B protein
MKVEQKKFNPILLLLRWADRDMIYLVLSVICSLISGLCIVVPYFGLYRLMDAILKENCTRHFVLQNILMITAAIMFRFTIFCLSVVLSHKGAYGALFRVRCKVLDHMARIPLGSLDDRRNGEIKTVLNEDIEKLELFLAHNLPELVYYFTGPVVVFIVTVHGIIV